MCMTVYLVISLPKIPYIHHIYMVLANPSGLCSKAVNVSLVCVLSVYTAEFLVCDVCVHCRDFLVCVMSVHTEEFF